MIHNELKKQKTKIHLTMVNQNLRPEKKKKQIKSHY